MLPGASAMQPRELLLILDAQQPLTAAPGRWRVTQKVSPRVVIVEVMDGSATDALRSSQPAVAVLEWGEALPENVRETLTAAEAMFADAFARRVEAKTRRGEGLDWDAEAFLPPDPPPKR
jgi:hypothetical protein